MSNLLLPKATRRAYRGEADLPAIVNLLNRCEAVDQLDAGTSLEEMRQGLSHPDLNPDLDLSLWESKDGQLLGFAEVAMPEVVQTCIGYLWFKVHPALRDTPLADDIIAWAEQRIKTVSQTHQQPARLQTSAKSSRHDRLAFLERHGFQPVRYFYHMTRPLAESIAQPQLPPGFQVRTVQREDAQTWVEMFNQTFIDHWNHHPITVEQFQFDLTGSDYRADLDLVAIAPDGTFAAFCSSGICPQENLRSGRNEGWIGVLGTRRGFRKLGLGRAMLLSGLQALQQAGVETALLGVDSENPSGALRLYESTGFCQMDTVIVQSKEIVGVAENVTEASFQPIDGTVKSYPLKDSLP